jgi:hypothetical protein
MVVFRSSLIALFIVLPLLTNGKSISTNLGSVEVTTIDQNKTPESSYTPQHVGELLPAESGEHHETTMEALATTDGHGKDKMMKVATDSKHETIKVATDGYGKQHKTTMEALAITESASDSSKNVKETPLDREGRLVKGDGNSTHQLVDDVLEDGKKISAGPVPETKTPATTEVPPTMPAENTPMPPTASTPKEATKVTTKKPISNGTSSSTTKGVIIENQSSTVVTKPDTSLPSTKSSTSERVHTGSTADHLVADGNTTTVDPKLTTSNPNSAATQGISMILFGLIGFYLI